MDTEQWEELARKRLQSILRTQTVSTWRTLEHKISDAGPNDQRPQPHILTRAKAQLERTGTIIRLDRSGGPWYHLAVTDPGMVARRLATLEPIHRATQDQGFTQRAGQTLEIAIFRALQSLPPSIPFFGGFPDLADHDDDRLYTKRDPPNFVSGRSSEGKLDFLLHHPEAGLVGVEAKNIREWLYPDRDEIAQLLLKCCQLDAVPVLIARRIHFLTARVFRTCGMVIHQTFTQLYPAADIDLANKAKHKNLLGYHDIRVGNAPDQRLLKFTLVNLPKILPAARRDFDRAKGPLLEYLKRKLSWHHFLIEIGLRDDAEEHGWDRSWNPNPD